MGDLWRRYAHGIQGNAAWWIMNWLDGRCRGFCINQTHSYWTPVTSGVPQGSVLGLLQFLIYINDQDNNVGSKISKFADDTKLCRKARHPDDIAELKEDINKLEDCGNKLQMKFYVGKWAVMHIGRNSIDAWQLHDVQPTGASNWTAERSWNHHQRPQVAAANREKMQNRQ